MSDVFVPLPTTLAECHAQLQQLAANNAALNAVNTEQRGAIDQQQATIDQQQATIDQQQATIDEQQATIDEQQTLLQSLQRDLALMKRTLFGQRRERFEDPRQGLLFESAEVGSPEQADHANEDDNGPDDGSSNEDEGRSPTRRRGRVRRVIPESLPRVKRVRKLTDAEIPEHLQGAAGRCFLKKVGEWVELEPPRLTVIEEYAETLAVDNADATETTMLTAERPPRILNCFAGPSLLAGLAVNHFADHLPYYRLEEILQRSQIVIDRSTQCRWMIRLAKKLAPLVKLMRSQALESPVVLADETPVKMLAPGQGKTQTTYLWAVLGDRQRPFTTFSFTESRARDGPAEFFADFGGVLVSDAYIGYEILGSTSQGRIRLASNDKGTFHSHLATGKNLDRYVTRQSPTTELAITHYRVLRRMADTTLVEVTLETGKRNQIRVQFADAEHPVLGDPRYQTKLAIHPRWIRKRIALHAKSLGFEHPVSGEAMQIESPLPSAIEKFLAGSR